MESIEWSNAAAAFHGSALNSPRKQRRPSAGTEDPRTARTQLADDKFCKSVGRCETCDEYEKLVAIVDAALDGDRSDDLKAPIAADNEQANSVLNCYGAAPSSFRLVRRLTFVLTYR